MAATAHFSYKKAAVLFEMDIVLCDALLIDRSVVRPTLKARVTLLGCRTW